MASHQKDGGGLPTFFKKKCNTVWDYFDSNVRYFYFAKAFL